MFQLIPPSSVWEACLHSLENNSKIVKRSVWFISKATQANLLNLTGLFLNTHTHRDPQPNNPPSIPALSPCFSSCLSQKHCRLFEWTQKETEKFGISEETDEDEQLGVKVCVNSGNSSWAVPSKTIQSLQKRRKNLNTRDTPGSGILRIKVLWVSSVVCSRPRACTVSYRETSETGGSPPNNTIKLLPPSRVSWGRRGGGAFC